MADEVSVNIGLQLNNGTLSYFLNNSFVGDQSERAIDVRVLNIGTSEENVTFPDLTTPGLIYLENFDATNFVQWGLNDGGTMKAIGRLLPRLVSGANDHVIWAIFHLDSGATLRMKADTASCEVLVVALGS